MAEPAHLNLLSPSERLERLAEALTALADDVLLTVRELRTRELGDDDDPPARPSPPPQRG